MRSMGRRRRRRLLAAALLIGAGLACHSPRVLAGWEATVGPAPNLVLPTLGGSQWWADVRWRGGWRVQRHAWTGHHRLLDESNRRRAWGTLEHCAHSLELSAEGEEPGTHLVLLLHGLGRTWRSLSGLQADLEEQGWRVACLSYPSTRGSIDSHARDVQGLLEHLDGVERVSFVTHSLGGIVARRVLTDSVAPWRERIDVGIVVQLAPPNQGAELARRLAACAPVRWICGRALSEVARPDGLGGGTLPEGSLIVAGVRGRPGGWNPWVEGDADLVVGVEETRLAGVETVSLPGALHTLVMDDPRARRLVSEALAQSSAPPGSSSPPFDRP